MATPPEGDATVSLPRGLPAAIIFLFIAIVGFVAVVAVGTGKMPESGNQAPLTNQMGQPISND